MSEAKKRQVHAPEFKAKVGLEALRGVKTINEIGQEYGVHPKFALPETSSFRRKPESRFHHLIRLLTLIKRLNWTPAYPMPDKQGLGRCFWRLIDPARFIHETVGCAMRTDWLNGAHGAPYGLAGNLGLIGPNQ